MSNQQQFFNRLTCLTFIIFILCLAIHNRENSHFSTKDEFYRNISLETILQQMPVCTFNDRFRQRNLLFMLHAWNDFANENHIQYWIAYGTLVGYVQRGGLLPHDSDIDVLILAEDTKQFVPFSDTNFSSTYEIKVHPQWNIVGWKNRSYHPLQAIDFVAPNARFIHRQHRYHIDIWPSYDYNPNQMKDQQTNMKTRTEYDKEYKWMSSPNEWTFPLKPCTFSGVNVKCPAMPENLVIMFYGLDAHNKSDKTCIKNNWV